MANGEKGKGRSQNQRLKLFYLLDYLLENTDEIHTVKVQEIIDHFDNYYKIPVEQKTVCSDLHLLDEYGYLPLSWRSKMYLRITFSLTLSTVLIPCSSLHHFSNNRRVCS